MGRFPPSGDKKKPLVLGGSPTPTISPLPHTTPSPVVTTGTRRQPTSKGVTPPLHPVVPKTRKPKGGGKPVRPKGKAPFVEGSETRTGRKSIRPQAKATITPRQQVFLNEWKVSKDATDAARKAGYAHPGVTGAKLLDGNYAPLVKLEADRFLALQEERAVKKAEDVLRYIHTAMWYNPLRFFRPGDSGGWLITEEDWASLPEWIGCMIEEMERRVKTVTRTDPATGEKYQDEEVTLWVRLVSKTKMTELAAKHQLGEKVNVQHVHINWDDLARAGSLTPRPEDDPVEARILAVEMEPARPLSLAPHSPSGLVELTPNPE